MVDLSIKIKSNQLRILELLWGVIEFMRINEVQLFEFLKLSLVNLIEIGLGLQDLALLFDEAQ